MNQQTLFTTRQQRKAVFDLAVARAKCEGLPRRQQTVAGKEAVACLKEGVNGWTAAKVAVDVIKAEFRAQNVTFLSDYRSNVVPFPTGPEAA